MHNDERHDDLGALLMTLETKMGDGHPQTAALGMREGDRALERYRALKPLRDEILALTSHDLRTPVTCIHGALDLLTPSLGGLDSEQLHLLSIVRRAADSLTLLVDNVVALTHPCETSETEGLSESDGDGFDSELVQVVREVTDLAAIGARRAGTLVTVEAAEGPVSVPGEPLFVRQFFANLMRYVLRTTPPRHEVRVTVRKSSPHRALLVVEHDTRENALGLAHVTALLAGRLDVLPPSDKNGERALLHIVGRLVRRLCGTVTLTERASSRRRIEIELPAR